MNVIYRLRKVIGVFFEVIQIKKHELKNRVSLLFYSMQNVCFIYFLLKQMGLRQSVF